MGCPRNRVNSTQPAKPTLFEDAAIEYLAWAKANKRSGLTDEHRLKPLRKRFAGKTLDEISAADVERFKTELAAERKPATVNRHLACLKTLFSRAVRDEKARTNPVKAVRLFRENNARVRWLTPEEETTLLPVVPEPYRSLCLAAIYTGLRLGELLGLTWDRVDYRTGILTVDRSKHGQTRRVPMNSLVVQTLRRIPRVLGDAHVFPTCMKVSHRFPVWAKAATSKASVSTTSATPSHRAS
jgi:integrase